MSKLTAILLAVPAALLLSGCASGHRTSAARPPTTVHTTSRLPQRVRIVPGRVRMKLNGHGAGFLSPTRLAFYRSGSGSCMPTPTTLTVTNPHSIRVRLEDDFASSCLLDLITEPVVVAIDPREIDVHRTLTVRLYYPRATHAEVFTAAPLS